MLNIKSHLTVRAKSILLIRVILKIKNRIKFDKIINTNKSNKSNTNNLKMLRQAHTVDTLLLAHLPFSLDGEAIQQKENLLCSSEHIGMLAQLQLCQNKNGWANEWISTVCTGLQAQCNATASTSFSGPPGVGLKLNVGGTNVSLYF